MGTVPGDWGAWARPVVISFTSPATISTVMLAMKK